jgi:hypothetical protein
MVSAFLSSSINATAIFFTRLRFNTAAKRESKEQLRTETIPPISTGTVTRMAIRQMLAAARSHEPQILEEKPGHLTNGAREREGRSFTCPSAAVTTAAKTSHAFPVAAADICKRTHS